MKGLQLRVGKGEWGQRGRALEGSSRDNILAAVMCHETTQGLYGCPISERLMKLRRTSKMRDVQAGFLISCEVAIFAVNQCAQKVTTLIS